MVGGLTLWWYCEDILLTYWVDSSSGFDDTFPAVSMGGATAPMSTEAGPGFALDAAWFGPEIMDWVGPDVLLLCLQALPWICLLTSGMQRGLDISLAHSHTSGGQTDGPGTIWTERTWPAGTGPEATGTGGDMADWMMAGQHTST